MRARSIIVIQPLLLALLITSPGSEPSADQQTGPPGAVVCGAIDMSHVDARLDWVDLLRIDVEPAEVVTLRARDGLFCGTGISPGRYLYLRYGGRTETGTTDLVYLFPPEGVSWAEFDPERPDLTAADIGQRDVVVNGADLYWLGARQVSPEGPTRYHTVTVGSPGEKEALERLLAIIEDPSARTLIQNRLKEIGKN
ncbi:hypothetical protein ACFL3H_06930 [Gemmatimonadota bacterium]